MVSRRNYGTIMLLMAVIFFLFFFMGSAKDQWNDYQNNRYAESSEELPAADCAWTENAAGARDYVVYIGDLDADAEGDTVRQWCTYSKRAVQAYRSLAEWTKSKTEMPEVLLIDPAYLETGTDSKLLKELAQEGVSMVFCRLPEPEVLKKDSRLREILGIQKVAADSQQLAGVKLFGGFLLGGEVHYIAEDPEDGKRQDLAVEVPWYQLGSGTKTYMAGVLEDGQAETVKNEQLPALIWRASCEEAKVFAVNGDYLEDVSGVGILSAMMAELHSYELYPVVNAQSLAILNGPDLTSENNVQMQELYSRYTRMVMRDVVLSGLAANSEVLEFPMTCLMTDKIDRADTEQPVAEDLEYYLKYLNEQRGEMGVSLLAQEGETLTEKAERLSGLLNENNILYPYSVLYAEENRLKEAAALLAEKENLSAIKSVNTVITEDTGDYDLLDYLDNTTTIQGRTQDGTYHSYRDDFRLRAMETGLGYSNVFLDVKQVIYPQSEEDHWENLSVEFSSNLNTSWKPFEAFDRIVLSESDKRVRKFLALDYADSRSENTVTLNVTALDGEAWFVLRTHEETIQEVKGASWEELEQDAYLLTVTEPEVVITLQQRLQPYYYDE